MSRCMRFLAVNNKHLSEQNMGEKTPQELKSKGKEIQVYVSVSDSEASS